MTAICVSLTEPTTAGVIDRMVDLAGAADLFEIRGDMVTDLDLLTLMRAQTHPLVFTCLPRSEGGRFDDGDAAGRRALLKEATKRGFDYVDVGFKSGFLDVIAEKAGKGLILSYHDVEGAPADLDGLYERMVEQGADIVKIAITARSIGDLGRLFDFAARRAEAGGTPLIPIAMGPLGIASRILGGRYGAPFVFASPAAGSEAAPGQIPAAVMADRFRVRQITAKTEVYGIVGTDVTWSLSPVIHNRGFLERGRDAVYVPLQAEALAPFLDALPALRLSGFSVTRPFKVEIVPRLDSVDWTATLAGSVNTVRVRGGRLEGSSTDGLGILVPLKRKTALKDRSVVILGAGGAARAAALALVHEGARVTVLARNPAQAAGVAKDTGCAAGDIARLADHPWDVLINATPVGSVSMPKVSPVPAGLLKRGAVVFDMVYEPLETRLLREADQAGCETIDGLQMLLAQAAGQFEAWTGQEAPDEAMKSAALVAIQEQLAQREGKR
jgi:shikimate dehydrogenase/3-dehydroquinate dehydratase type I